MHTRVGAVAVGSTAAWGNNSTSLSESTTGTTGNNSTSLSESSTGTTGSWEGIKGGNCRGEGGAECSCEHVVGWKELG